MADPPRGARVTRLPDGRRGPPRRPRCPPFARVSMIRSKRSSSAARSSRISALEALLGQPRPPPCRRRQPASDSQAAPGSAGKPRAPPRSQQRDAARPRPGAVAHTPARSPRHTERHARHRVAEQAPAPAEREHPRQARPVPRTTPQRQRPAARRPPATAANVSDAERAVADRQSRRAGPRTGAAGSSVRAGRAWPAQGGFGAPQASSSRLQSAHRLRPRRRRPADHTGR